MHLHAFPSRLQRIAALDLEAVSIGSVIAATVPALSPLAWEASTMLAITLTVFAAPIATVLGARSLLARREPSLR